MLFATDARRATRMRVALSYPGRAERQNSVTEHGSYVRQRTEERRDRRPSRSRRLRSQTSGRCLGGEQAIRFAFDYCVALAHPLFQAWPVEHQDVPAIVVDQSVRLQLDGR